MPFFRFAALFFLLSAAVLLTGALTSQPVSSDSPSSASSPSAVQVLDQALARLDPKRIAWLHFNIWQKAQIARLAYESEGRYLAGPNKLFRLELTTRHGIAAVTSLSVSDGVTLWQGIQTGDGGWGDVASEKVGQVRHTFPVAGVLAPLRENHLHTQSLGGVVPLLESLKTSILLTRKETVRRRDHIFVKLTGTFAQDDPNRPASSDQSGPDGLLRRCCLYFESETLWPHRLEWWGVDPDRPGESLLVQLELRDPILNQGLSAEECAREFSIPAGADTAKSQSRSGDVPAQGLLVPRRSSR
jgi:hypothetical protein